ncbi:hypothetical protein ACFPK5_02260 [Streptomyces beijiangensis]
MEDSEDRPKSGAPAEMVSAQPSSHRGWTWALGAVVATSMAWALTLQGIGYGDVSPPDLHHYRIAESPCSGDNLKPLTDALGTSRFEVTPAVTRTGSVLDQAQCVLTAQAPVGTHWHASYAVTVTVELHKKTNPAPEFEDRNRPHGPNLDPDSSTAAIDETDRVVPVPDLGDKAYLLVGNELDQTLTVLQGGAVFTIGVDAYEQWTGSGEVPPDVNGYPQQPPSMSRLHPALIATIRRLMSA